MADTGYVPDSWILQIGNVEYVMHAGDGNEDYVSGYFKALSEVVSKLNNHQYQQPFCTLKKHVRYTGGG